jgi:hypothetical protein
MPLHGGEAQQGRYVGLCLSRISDPEVCTPASRNTAMTSGFEFSASTGGDARPCRRAFGRLDLDAYRRRGFSRAWPACAKSADSRPTSPTRAHNSADRRLDQSTRNGVARAFGSDYSRTSAEEKIEDDIAACRAVHDRAGHQLHWLEGRVQCKQTSLDVNVYWLFPWILAVGKNARLS